MLPALLCVFLLQQGSYFQQLGATIALVWRPKPSAGRSRISPCGVAAAAQTFHSRSVYTTKRWAWFEQQDQKSNSLKETVQNPVPATGY